MVLILLSTVFFIATSYPLGAMLINGRGVKSPLRGNILLYSFAGTLIVAVCAAIVALFGLPSWVNMILISLLAVPAWYASDLEALRKEIRGLSIRSAIVAGTGLLLMLAIAALPSNYFEEGNFILPTMRYLEQYGFVKGLANLDWNYSRISFWGLLNASYSWGVFNDINLYLTTALLLDSILNWKKKSPVYDWGNIALLGLSIFFLPSSSVVWTVMLGVYAVMQLMESGTEQKRTLLLLTYLALLHELAFPLAVLLIGVLLMSDRIKLSDLGFQLTGVGVLVLLWMAKNSILTGYPLFPLTSFAIGSVDWQVPVDFVALPIRAYGAYFISVMTGLGLNEQSLLVYGSLGLFIVIVSGSLLLKKYHWSRRLILGALLLVLSITSGLALGRWHWALPYLLLLVYLLKYSDLSRSWVGSVSRNAVISKSLISLSFLIAIALVSGQSESLNNFISGRSFSSFPKFSTGYMLQPAPLWKNDRFDQKRGFNISWDAYCWDMPLPAIKAASWEKVHNELQMEPEWRSEDLKDGFKMKENVDVYGDW